MNEPRPIADRDLPEPAENPGRAAGLALVRARLPPWKAFLLVWLVPYLALFRVALHLEMHVIEGRLERDVRGLESELARNADLNDAIIMNAEPLVQCALTPCRG